MKKELLLGLWMLASWATFAQEWVAQEIDTIESNDKVKQEIVMQQDSTNQELAKTMTFEDAIRFMNWNTDTWEWTWIVSDPVWWDIDEWDMSKYDSVADEQSSKQWRLKVHWMLQVWTGVAWDAAEVCSDKATLIAVVDLSDSKTWLWFTTVRLDDFHNDPESPFSRVTVLNPHLTKNFWKDWKFRASLEWKITVPDQLPQASSFSPDVVLSYNADGWRTFEWMYAHKFKSWPDSDAFRLTVAKKINEALKITWQWWYETWYDKHFYWRTIVDVNLWNWLCAQLSCIAKHWKLTPTSWILYQF